MVEQSQKALYAIYYKLRNINLPLDLQFKLFDCMVGPILMYASEIWGYENVDMIEKIHLNFLKRTLKVRSSTPNYMVYGETGRFPLSISIKLKMLGFWTRLLQSANNKLSGILYQMIYMLHGSCQFSFKWISFMQNMFNNLGFSYIWDAQLPLTMADIKTEVKQRLIDHFCQKLFDDMENSSRGKFYSSFKTTLNLEKYLLNLNSDRYTISKLRCSNIKFPVEVGRWRNIPLEERICQHCDMNIIGDEFHYFCICNNAGIKSLREKFIPPYFYRYPTREKLVGLFSYCNITVLTKVSRFIQNLEKILL